MATPATMRGQSSASRRPRQAKTANGRKRNSAATVSQDFSAATDPGAEIRAGSQ